jgi:hypothetical protein
MADGGKMQVEKEAAMKMRVCLAIMAAVSSPAIAQVHQPPLRILCEPATHEHDAVRAAPDQHEVLFEDDHVRVLQIHLPSLSVEPIHIHALPSVIMGDTGGAAGARFVYTEYRMENGEFVEVSRQDITPTPGQRTVWAAPEGPHSIANTGPVPVRFTRMEIKPETCAAR